MFNPVFLYDFISHLCNKNDVRIFTMNNEAIQTTPEQEKDVRKKADQVMVQIPALLEAAHKSMTDEQLHKLELHLVAMARRSLFGGRLPDFDKDLFDEISEPSIKLAQSVVDLFEGLPEEEALILSIHFEMAQDKSK